MTLREKMREIQREADRICSLIVASDYPEIDIELMKAALREKVEEYFPDGLDLYEMIYESRFRRLKEQFRNED
jgi:predicted house-cleaning noncanonical NTP pyrophosphatase (MazG superfamily)